MYNILKKSVFSSETLDNPILVIGTASLNNKMGIRLRIMSLLYDPDNVKGFSELFGRIMLVITTTRSALRKLK